MNIEESKIENQNIELTDFLIKIQREVSEIRLRFKKEICITISINRTKEIFEKYNTTYEITSFQLFGFNTYPSEFISDNDFIVGYKN
jgi:hypothetical protein